MILDRPAGGSCGNAEMTDKARRPFCQDCAVVTDCWSVGMRNPETPGIWGGLSQVQRQGRASTFNRHLDEISDGRRMASEPQREHDRLAALPTDLYRFFDDEGRLLYVGISLSAAQRASSHRSQSGWWACAVRMEIEHLTNREEARTAELQAIRTESPLHNIEGRAA